MILPSDMIRETLGESDDDVSSANRNVSDYTHISRVKYKN